MIQQEKMKVIHHRSIATNIYELVLHGQLVNEMKNPGQFVHIRVSDSYEPLLRRPISICSIDQENLECTLLYRAGGRGTQLLSLKQTGDMVDVLGPLGNGFPLDAINSGETALLIGGGIGVPPLYELASRLQQKGVRTIHVLGFQSIGDVFYEEQFKALGETHIVTADGSYGSKGFVTDLLMQEKPEFNVFYSCGPTPMLKAIEQTYPDKLGFLSFEERMGCGIGACYACVCETTDGVSQDYLKVCSDGPVFKRGVVAL
ncbi:dihydroorotate dehydrogenase electron transfer subunit [Rummeliibacillus stabekisii]|uniref:dihydroorotate dehydrogenase electron transfer subunit n=1 Tax=Rummeliibacillus stabekisii TaxID=241244 RepID=UPI00203EC021|nr:dihydroorotate dehydrogenase electron transfer subunit [Rummeliibacillus stabekisii]MCM3315751.1 dihydroorotate dehydrogenase electron transfer subunit [Rummeliibacillus stabekisii]